MGYATCTSPKKDGGVRICGDYKPTVNKQIEIAHHPLPTVELITSKLSGNTVFSKIDLKTAFQQLELDEASKELCTVNTNKGLFKVNRLPFGVASSPALWQRTILFEKLRDWKTYIGTRRRQPRCHSVNRAMQYERIHHTESRWTTKRSFSNNIVY